MPTPLPSDTPVLDRIRASQLAGADDVPPPFAAPVRVPRRARWRRFVLVVAIGLLGLAVALVAAASWTQTESGRRWVADRVEEVITGQIRGQLHIAQLDAVDLHHVAGRGVRFDDESGRPVIEADEVDMRLDVEALLDGRFVSSGSEVHGGRVWIETDPSGELLLSRAFRSPHPSAPGTPVGDDVVHLESVHASDVVVRTALGAAPVATLSGVDAIVLVRVPENGAAIVETRHARGRLHVAAPIPFDLRVRAGSLSVDGAARRRVHVDLPSRMGRERIGIELTANADAHQSLSVDARIRPHGLSAMLAASGMISQCLIAETQSDALDVTVEMQ